MVRRLRKLRDDESGMFLVFVGLGFMGFLICATLAIDVGQFMVARSQAQNSADAGALGGAVALVFDNYADRSAAGPAVQNAVMMAQANQVIAQDVSVTTADVTFPTPERIRVDVFRTGGRGNALATLIGGFFGLTEADISATATAEVVPANAATCVKPWGIPDKWIEMQTPAWDPNVDEVNMYVENGKGKGNPLPNPDIYHGVGGGGYTGYDPSPQGLDYGIQVCLKPGNPAQAINAGHFYPLAMPGGNGADWYRDNIQGCWPGVGEIGDLIPVEPGNQIGPTGQGVQALIDADPNAFWDTAADEIVSDQSPSSRTVVIPVFDPNVYELGRQSGRLDIQIANFVGFFIEDMVGNDVLGRVIPNVGLIRGDPNGGPQGSFLRAIRLVE